MIAIQHHLSITNYFEMNKFRKNYKQFDPNWAKLPYGPSGTMKSSGCGATALAEALTYFGFDINPVQMAKILVDEKYRIVGRGTAPSAMIEIPQSYGLKSIKTSAAKLPKLFEDQSSGAAILHASGAFSRKQPGKNPNHFTKNGHYFICYGYSIKSGFDINDVGSSNPKRNGWIPSEIVLQNCNLVWFISLG